MKQVNIYTTPTCVYCKMAKEFFQENGVKYTEYNVSTDLNARNAMIEKSGQMGVPVIMVDDQVVVGFNEPKLRNLLGL